jgi:amino acid transporter
MRKFKINKDFKIKLPIIILSLFIFIGILSYQFNTSNFYIISTIIGFLTMIVAIFSMIGLYNAIKKAKNPSTFKRVLYVLMMAIFVCTILYIIVENIMEAIKVFF